MILVLRYNHLPVGVITDVFESHPSWFGKFRKAMAPARSFLPLRIGEFIDFCQQWHARSDAGAGDLSSSDFAPFHDLIYSGVWDIEAAEDGKISILRNAPVFYDDEVTWQLLDAPAKATRHGG